MWVPAVFLQSLSTTAAKRHGWAGACGIAWYVPMGGTRARAFDNPLLNMPLFEPEMEAGSIMNSIITQI